MQASLTGDKGCRLFGRVRGSLLHYYQQVPTRMRPQQLLEKLDHLHGGDPLVVQAEHQPALSVDRRHYGNRSSLARDLLLRCPPADSPSLSQQSRQRNTGFILAVQNRPIFSDRRADLRQSSSQPLLSCYGVCLEVLPRGLLIGQARFLKSANDCSGCHGHRKLLADDLVNPLSGPEISLEAERGSGLEN